jgi:hypothetical protein
LKKALARGTTSAGADATDWGVFRTNADFPTGNDGVSPGGATYSYLYANGDNTPTAGAIQYTGIHLADAPFGATCTYSEDAVRPVPGANGTLDNGACWSGVLGPRIDTLALGGAGLTDYADLYSNVRDSNAGTSSDPLANIAYAADRLARKLAVTGFTVTPVLRSASVRMLGGRPGHAGILRVAPPLHARLAREPRITRPAPSSRGTEPLSRPAGGTSLFFRL